MKKQKDNPLNLNNPFAKDLDFTHGDLESNRAGFVSHRQKQLLWRKWYKTVFIYSLISGFITLFPTISFLGDYVRYNSYIVSFNAIVFYAILGISGILILLFAIRSNIQLRHELNEERIIAEESGTYIVYMTGISRKILSAEAISLEEIE